MLVIAPTLKQQPARFIVAVANKGSTRRYATHLVIFESDMQFDQAQQNAGWNREKFPRTRLHRRWQRMHFVGYKLPERSSIEPSPHDNVL